ncbi:hypothetical protein SLA2020_452430 [Shorea laevis]
MQRAKRSWFQGGDRNTTYFHSWANQRRKTNHIRKVKDEVGREWTRPSDYCRSFIQHFQSLFTSGGPDDIDACIAEVPLRVTSTMNGQLLRAFTPEEIDMALAQMHPLKSPGPDGFLAGFYQQHWEVVGPDVRRAVLSFLQTGVMDENLIPLI